MVVSDDKPRRKAAFQIVKSKNILTTQLGSDAALSTPSVESFHPYEDVQYLDDEFEPGTEVRSLLSAEVCALEYPSQKQPTWVHFHTSPHSHSHNAATATCGGLFQHGNEVYALTMAHTVHPIRRAIMSSEPHSDSSSQSNDFEITGIDDWDDDDEENIKTLTAMTSPGSKTSSENSDSESLLKPYDSHLSEISIQIPVGPGPSMVYKEDCIVEIYKDEYEDESENENDIFDMCERIGSIVSVDQALDIAVIKMTSNKPTADSLDKCFLTEMLADSDPTNTSIIIKTTHHPEIRGKRSMNPFYTRLPGKSNFLELYGVQLSTPVYPGDSGSWAFNDKRELIGLVIAGNPKTKSCLLLPSKPALLSILSLLRSRESSAEIGSLASPKSIQPPHGPWNNTIYYCVLYYYAGICTPSRDFTHTSKENFLEEQAARLRRELERAWEIIQEKDNLLQETTADDIEHVLDILTKDATPLQSKNHASSQLGLGQDSIQKPTPSSPSEQSHSRPAFNQYLEANPNMSIPDYQELTSLLLRRIEVLETELEIDRGIIKETRAMWRTQVDANEALNRENNELKMGVSQAIDAIYKVHGDKEANDHGGLLKIPSNLGRFLHNNTDLKPFSGEVKIKKELEPSWTGRMDILPLSDRRSKRRSPGGGRLTFGEYVEKSSLSLRQKRAIIRAQKYKRNPGFILLPRHPKIRAPRF
ncbi:hypothetical protein CHU98_g7909 [Xylaria longipes]|nr:hypothetical protein CHU98_g7909 [Xylaria longipes]